QAERRHRLAELGRAADRPGRPVEGREEAVAGRVDRAAAEANELAAHELMVALEQLAPSAIAERGGALTGADDVGEEHGSEHAVGLALLPATRVPAFPQETLDPDRGGSRA